MTMYTEDAFQAALSFAVQQQAHIEPGVYATKYPDIQYSTLVPVDTSAHPFAKTVTHYSSDQFGLAKWVNGNSDDIPLAGTELAKHESAVHMAGIGYGWGYEELGYAQMMGINLPANDAAAARRAAEEHIDGVVLRGDAAKGMEGLINNSAVTVAGVTNGSWATATEDQILADVNTLLIGIGVASKYVGMADTLLMDDESMNLIATRRLGDTGMTILSFLMQHNTYTARTGQQLTVRTVRGLETAGVGNTRRIVAYRRSPEVLKFHMPMPFRFLDVYRQGPMNYVVPGVFRLGGLDIRLPTEVRYGDGI